MYANFVVSLRIASIEAVRESTQNNSCSTLLRFWVFSFQELLSINIQGVSLNHFAASWLISGEFFSESCKEFLHL